MSIIDTEYYRVWQVAKVSTPSGIRVLLALEKCGDTGGFATDVAKRLGDMGFWIIVKLLELVSEGIVNSEWKRVPNGTATHRLFTINGKGKKLLADAREALKEEGK